VPGSEEIAEAERALERLFRLTANRRVHARQSAAAGAFVSRPGFAILRSLADTDQRSVGDIAKVCLADPASVGRQVKTLEDEGFVERQASAGDGRVVVVRLTPSGRSAYDRIVQVRAQHMGEVLSGWTSAERQSLTSLVNRLVDDFKSVPLRPAPPAFGGPS
jgi:DNA-binding MarR family transcriptional regulator